MFKLNIRFKASAKRMNEAVKKVKENNQIDFKKLRKDSRGSVQNKGFDDFTKRFSEIVSKSTGVPVGVLAPGLAHIDPYKERTAGLIAAEKLGIPFADEIDKYQETKGGSMPTFSVTAAAYQTHHEVKINKASNGFIITIGCKTFVATSEKEMFKGLSEYFADPAKAEAKYCGKN